MHWNRQKCVEFYWQHNFQFWCVCLLPDVSTLEIVDAQQKTWLIPMEAEIADQRLWCKSVSFALITPKTQSKVCKARSPVSTHCCSMNQKYEHQYVSSLQKCTYDKHENNSACSQHMRADTETNETTMFSIADSASVASLDSFLHVVYQHVAKFLQRWAST